MAGVGGCLEDERGLGHELRTLRRARGLAAATAASTHPVQVTGEVGRPAERDQHLAALDVGQRGRSSASAAR